MAAHTMEVLKPAIGFWNAGQDGTAAARVVAGPQNYDGRWVSADGR